MSNLPELIEQSIRARALFRPGEKILIAVSGGVDSMILLRVLHKLAAKYRWHLAVAHLNHQLRGRSSDADERLVTRTARQLGVSVIVERVDVKKIARARKLSLEMAAREVRHEFLARTAERLKIRRIALAHHADDQIELFFLRLLRGAGSEGLAGMNWCSPSPVSRRVELVRPLLDKSKQALRAYAAAERVQFREDATNASLDIRRNRVRHELLPLLRQKYQPALGGIILRLMDILGAESEFLEAEARKASGAFGNLPVALQRRVVQFQLLQQAIPPDFELIERLRLSESAFPAGPQCTIRRDASGAIHRTANGPVLPDSSRAKVTLTGRAGDVGFDEVRIHWRRATRKTGAHPKSLPGREFFDADKIGTRIVLRHWQSGDRFQPIGMAQAVKLQDLFTNQKIPRARRHELIVATTAGGEIFWVEGLRIGELAKLTPGTRRRLEWQWKRLPAQEKRRREGAARNLDNR